MQNQDFVVHNAMKQWYSNVLCHRPLDCAADEDEDHDSFVKHKAGC
jgi:hypothetical protein